MEITRNLNHLKLKILILTLIAVFASSCMPAQNFTRGTALPAPDQSKETLATSTTIVPAFIPFIAREPTLTPSPTATPEPAPPNILLILSDDQRFDTIDYMPRTKSRIFNEGARFSRAYITTSSCCPSRSSILTGMYAHHHGVLVNNDPLEKKTFVQELKDTGYLTALVGKYLNSWDGSVRSEFDFWVSFAGGSSSYFDPHLNVHGEWQDRPGYITYILRDYALNFLDSALQQEQPFLLIYSPNAPHEPAFPATEDENLYADLPDYRPPSFNEEDVSDKPDWIQTLPIIADGDVQDIDAVRRRQLQSLNALDIAVESILDRIAEHGELDRTFVLYLSDNGYFWGEHRLRRGKGYAYEESILVPFAIRYPPLIPAAREVSELVANIDIAPTLYELAGLSIPSDTDGLSLMALLEAQGNWRDQLIVENWIEPDHYSAVRSDQYLYVAWDQFDPELYDTILDPYQLENLANLPEYSPVVAEFQAYLDEMHPEEP